MPVSGFGQASLHSGYFLVGWVEQATRLYRAATRRSEERNAGNMLVVSPIKSAPFF